MTQPTELFVVSATLAFIGFVPPAAAQGARRERSDKAADDAER
jgi:hypothetical protein